MLHEENIALLTPGFANIKEKLKQAKEPVVKGEIKLVGKEILNLKKNTEFCKFRNF